MADFKVRVVENIGEDSKYYFGEVGTEHIIASDNLVDLRGDSWKKCGIAFKSIQSVNDFFGGEDIFQTVFELVDEPC